MPSLPNESLNAVPPKPEGPPKRTLLIVDDEEGARQALLVLFKEDYNVLLAESGARAIEMVRRHSVDAAVLDIRMAGMTGIEALSHLKKMDPALEVIMLTAYETVETARQAIRLGACDYLTKPFDIFSMRQAVATAMTRRSLSEAIRAQSQKLMQLQDEIHSQRVREEMARSRGEIYASIIHDINSPLTTISGFLQLINRTIGNSTRIEGEQLESIKRSLDRISTQATNCIQVCRRYLGFFRDEVSEDAAADLQQVLSDLKALLQAHTEFEIDRLTVHPAPENASAQINSIDLTQILLNLTLNAAQSSTPPPTIAIEAQCVSEPLDLARLRAASGERFISHEEFRNTAALIAIHVRDTGTGIPSGVLDQIFNPYFSTKVAGQGTGLGLSIVKRLVERAKGGIHVQTKLGFGTSFTIYLPASACGGPS
jgi:two-component system, sensor histidine kinase and response regulator